MKNVTTTAAAASALDPALLARIADLELVARIIVEGLVSGLHRSPFHGYSAEFSQYRHYRPGDDLKYVDWKLAARTDRFYTKQFRETTNMAATLVVDTSASMDFPYVGRVLSDPARLTKFRYAVLASAALAHLISRQGDAVGLVAAGGRFIPPRTGRQHLRGLLAALGDLGGSRPPSPRLRWSAEALRGGGRTRPTESGPLAWDGTETIRRAADRMTRRGLLLVLSDFYDDEERAFAELRRAARMGHEVVLFQILSRDEIEFPYKSDFEFTDLETGRSVAVNAAVARRKYRDEVAAFLERWRSRAGAEGFQYSLIVTDTPIERSLRSVLLARGN
ncbi:MAG: DUF58 domain-containing protein [Acidobacteria bacterium]|nr:DUF58 domain-containing protein [Acidobacteriota bacterium]